MRLGRNPASERVRPGRLRRVIDRIDLMPVGETMFASMLLLVLVAAADYLTGRELSFSIFYVAPVMLMSWRIGRTAGLVTSGFAALTWYLADRWSGNRYSQVLIPVWNSFVRLAFFALIASLTSGLRLLLRQHADDAEFDPLTGLLNRRGFEARAATEVERTRRHGHALTLAYIDLDDFKRVNDTAGHAAGDAVLVHVGDVARATLRAIDIVGRIGGDEFAVLLPDMTEVHARAVMERFGHALEGNGAGRRELLDRSGHVRRSTALDQDCVGAGGRSDVSRQGLAASSARRRAASADRVTGQGNRRDAFGGLLGVVAGAGQRARLDVTDPEILPDALPPIELPGLDPAGDREMMRRRSEVLTDRDDVTPDRRRGRPMHPPSRRRSRRARP